MADFLSRIENGEEAVGISDQLPDADLFSIQSWSTSSFSDKMLLFLTDGLLPEDMSVDQRRKFVLKSKPFLVIAGGLYRKGVDQIIRRVVPDFEQRAVLQEAHVGLSGGHFSGEITSKKNLAIRLMVAYHIERCS